MKKILAITIALLLCLTTTLPVIASTDHGDAPQPYPLLVDGIDGDGQDYGDAPSPYPTLMVEGGAAHEVSPFVFIGASVDSEPDGQPNADATGDDISPPGAYDDEDGIDFLWPLFPGTSPYVQITIPPGASWGYLNGWVDFNADGDWLDPLEQVFSDAVFASPGTWVYSINVPNDASLGYTFARFRYSTVPGLEPGGFAPDGEVEDYRVEIVTPFGSISGMKWNDIDGNTQKDPGEPGIGGWIITLTDDSGNIIANVTTDADGNYIFGSLEQGTYHISENPALGWTQTYPSTGSHKIVMDIGQNIEDVDFGNKQVNGPGPGPGPEVGGTVYPVNKANLLAPWLILMAAIIAGSVIVVRRRHTQN